MVPIRNNEIIPDQTSPIGQELQTTSELEVDSTKDIASGNPTQLSDALDQNKLTPDKILSESQENKNLCGGAKDLSKAHKKSVSLPNLSWENIDNSLFISYPTRDKRYVASTRRMSVGMIDGVDCSKWSERDFSCELKNRAGEVQNRD